MSCFDTVFVNNANDKYILWISYYFVPTPEIECAMLIENAFEKYKNDSSLSLKQRNDVYKDILEEIKIENILKINKRSGKYFEMKFDKKPYLE